MTDRDYAALPRAIADALGAEQGSTTAVADGRGADTMTGPTPDSAGLRFFTEAAYNSIIAAAGSPTTAAIIAAVTAIVPPQTPAGDVAAAVADWRDGGALDVRAAILIADGDTLHLPLLRQRIAEHLLVDKTEATPLTAAIAAIDAALA